MGYATDLTLAADHDAQTTVPLLIGTAFRDDTARPGGRIVSQVPVP